MKVVAVMNQKGGVGKTTTTCNLGAAFARRGVRVLVIDLDPQAHLSLHLSHDVNAGTPTIYEVLVESLPIEQAVVATSSPGLSLLPAHIDLASAELELAGEIGRETLLRNALAELASRGTHDLVLIDCPPSLGLLSLNGLTASDEVLIPLQAEFFALHGISRLTEVMEMLRRRLKRGPQLLGIALCRMQATTRLAREVEEEARRHFGARVFKTTIRQNVRLAEASSHGQTVFEYDPNSLGAKDYAALAEEIAAAWSATPVTAAPLAAAAAVAPAASTTSTMPTTATTSTKTSTKTSAPATSAPATSAPASSAPAATTSSGPAAARANGAGRSNGAHAPAPVAKGIAKEIRKRAARPSPGEPGPARPAYGDPEGSSDRA